MSIATLDQYIAAAKQQVNIVKTTTRTTIVAAWFSLWDLAGNPGAGTLAGDSTTAGVVPDNNTAGAPLLNSFGGGALGYITTVDFGCNGACRMLLADLLWKGGAYAFNAAVNLSAQPSYAARVPGGTDFTGTQIWIEAVTAFTGNLSIAVTYTNQSGVAARTTGTRSLGIAPTVGRMIQLPLQAGDTGVQKIESVTATVATVGTFNVLVLRPLWTGRVRSGNDGDIHGLDKTGMPQVFATSALFLAIAADSTTSGIPELQVEIANA